MKLQRKIQPPIRQVKLKDIPEASLETLDNGIPLYLLNSGDEDILRIDLLFDGGQIRETIPLVASTTNMMLLEGSENYNANEINSAFDYYGAFVNPFTQKDISGISVFLLNKHLRNIGELCQEIVFRPLFPEKELAHLQEKRLQTFLINRKRVQNLASDKFFESIFGIDHPYGRQVLEDDFNNVLNNNLVDFHHKSYEKGPAAIITSGKVRNQTTEVINNFFGRHNTGINRNKSQKTTIRGNKNRKEYVIKKDAVQSAIRIGSAVINKRHPDYNGLMVVDTILGGYFGSRLMKNIREDKGYTYGIHSSLVSLQQSGYKIIATEVGKEHTQKALHEIYSEINRLQTQPVEKEELEIVRNYMAGEMVRMFDGPFASADSFRAVLEFGLDNSYYLNLAETVSNITSEEIMQLAKRYYNIEDLYEIVAGPK
jgi:zinc protease